MQWPANFRQRVQLPLSTFADDCCPVAFGRISRSLCILKDPNSRPSPPLDHLVSRPIRQGLHLKHGGRFITKSTVVNVTHFFSGTSAYHYFAIFATNMRLAEYGVINPARADNT